MNTVDRAIHSLTDLEYVANVAIKTKLAEMCDEDLLFASRSVQYLAGGRSRQIMIAFAVEIRKRYAAKIGWTEPVPYTVDAANAKDV